jgi:hypothetical protein
MKSVFIYVMSEFLMSEFLMSEFLTYILWLDVRIFNIYIMVRCQNF